MTCSESHLGKQLDFLLTPSSSMGRGLFPHIHLAMAQYQYRCPSCRFVFVTNSRTDIPPCPVCGSQSRRDFVFNTTPSIPDHFNTTVGGYVSNERELRDSLKRISDEQSERVGMEHRYEYLTRAEMADPIAHGVTDEGLDSTYRVHHDEAI